MSVENLKYKYIVKNNGKNNSGGIWVCFDKGEVVYSDTPLTVGHLFIYTDDCSIGQFICADQLEAFDSRTVLQKINEMEL
jgi:hypothetical protein